MHVCSALLLAPVVYMNNNYTVLWKQKQSNYVTQSRSVAWEITVVCQNDCWPHSNAPATHCTKRLQEHLAVQHLTKTIVHLALCSLISLSCFRTDSCDVRLNQSVVKRHYAFAACQWLNRTLRLFNSTFNSALMQLLLHHFFLLGYFAQYYPTVLTFIEHSVL